MHDELTGQKFGRLFVIELFYKTMSNGKKTQYAHCICDCGKHKNVSIYHLKNGKTQSCGCLHREITQNTANDLTGTVFGRLTVVGRDPEYVRARWLCKCSCGSITSVDPRNLKSGEVSSCGCLQKELAAERYTKNEIGKRYGKLVVLEMFRKPKSDGNGNMVYFRCQCDCGNFTEVWGAHLRSGKIVSCGCYAKEVLSKANITHGLSGTKEYNRYKARRYDERKHLYDTQWTFELEKNLRTLFGACVLCGMTEQEHQEKYHQSLHIDHVNPLNNGNGLVPGNATILCIACNCRKQAKSLDQLDSWTRNRLLLTADLFNILYG